MVIYHVGTDEWLASTGAPIEQGAPVGSAQLLVATAKKGLSVRQLSFQKEAEGFSASSYVQQQRKMPC